MKSRATTPIAGTIPTKRQVSPEFAALTDRLTALRDEQRNLQGEARTLAIRSSAQLRPTVC